MIGYGLLRRVLFAMEPERAHDWTIRLLKLGPPPRRMAPVDPMLETHVAGLSFANPLGLAAGFDKNAEVVRPMLGLGFGFVEAGTVTPRRQAGNPRPRLFRLPEDRAVINRFGFNSAGAEIVAERLAALRAGSVGGLVGVNIGPNRDSADPPAECAALLVRLAPLADFMVINVSSPNTAGLRAWQAADALQGMLAALTAARDRAEARPPLFCKVAPDLDADARSAIAEVVLRAGIDGLIATNTTVARPADLRSAARRESGGLSGRPLMASSTAVLKDFFRLTQGRLALIGVGGVASGADAYAKIRAGASLVELYTALVYEGPGLIGRLLADLAELLRRDGFVRVADAVGADVAAEAGYRATAGTAP